MGKYHFKDFPEKGKSGFMVGTALECAKAIFRAEGFSNGAVRQLEGPYNEILGTWVFGYYEEKHPRANKLTKVGSDLVITFD